MCRTITDKPSANCQWIMLLTAQTTPTSNTSKDSWATLQIWQQQRWFRTSRACKVQRKETLVRHHSLQVASLAKELIQCILVIKCQTKDALSQRMTSTRIKKLPLVWHLEVSILNKSPWTVWIWIHRTLKAHRTHASHQLTWLREMEWSKVMWCRREQEGLRAETVPIWASTTLQLLHQASSIDPNQRHRSESRHKMQLATVLN